MIFDSDAFIYSGINGTIWCLSPYLVGAKITIRFQSLVL